VTISLSLIHTYYSSLQHALSLLNLLCVHRLSPGNGSQRRRFLGFRPCWLRLYYNSALLRNGSARAECLGRPPTGVSHVLAAGSRLLLCHLPPGQGRGTSSDCLPPNSTHAQLTPPSQDWFACPVGRHDVASGRIAQKSPPPTVLSLRVSAVAVV
jgi:hypothetical protein